MFRKYIFIAAGMLAAWLLIASLARAQSHDHDAAAALALAQAGKKQGIDPTNPNVFHYPVTDYELAMQRAITERKPLVTFVGIPQRAVTGAIVCSVDKLAGVPAAAIIVGVPSLDRKRLDWIDTLPASTTDAEIIATWQLTEPVRKAASPMAAPFESSGKLPRAERDDSDLGRGPWPASLDFPEGMVRYRRATRTQAIAVSNGQDSIVPTPRTVLEPKYHQSGGMQGLRFRSDVYKLASIKPRLFIGNISVKNGHKHRDFNGQMVETHQDNRGWKREYPPGAKFMDVLSNVDTGKVFEVRKLEKKGPTTGDWEIFVDFEDPAERPAGYTGKLGVSCSSCHVEAGSGSYNAGLVIGGEFVLSDPFPALER